MVWVIVSVSVSLESRITNSDPLKTLNPATTNGSLIRWCRLVVCGYIDGTLERERLKDTFFLASSGYVSLAGREICTKVKFLKAAVYQLFYLALHSTHFYLRLYGVRHLVKYHSERGNQLPPHGLLLLISSKGSFVCTSQRQDNTYYCLCYTSREVVE